MSRNEIAPRERSQMSQILRLIASGRATTRADLARLAGLSASTVSQRTNALIDADLLLDEGFNESSGGRRASLLKINPTAGVIGAVIIGASTCRCAIVDLNGKVLLSSSIVLPLSEGPAAALPPAADELARLQNRLDSQRPMMAVSLGMASVVSTADGRLVRPLMGHEWEGADLTLAFREAFPETPVFISNDADLMALGEYHERHMNGRSLIFIKVGTGIGSGIIDRGRLVRGATGAAGDIGHVHVTGRDDARCTCGKTGCLTAVASGRAIAEQLRALGLEVKGSPDVLTLVRGGDLEAKHAIRAAAQAIGSVVATLVSFANPDLIVIGGLLGDLSEDLLTHIRSSVYGIAQPLATGDLAIESSVLGEDAAAVGAAHIALDHLLSPTGLPRLV